jgi:NAD-dependent DNA ligase
MQAPASSALGMQAPASSALGMQALKIDQGTPRQQRVPTNKMAASKLQSLLTSLQKANWAYHNTDTPTMTDAEYDRSLAELRRLSPSHPFLKKVGAPPGDRGSTLMPVVLGSLDKIHPGDGGLARWKARMNAKQYVVSEKLDGLSALYVGGAYPRLYLRGDGVKGVDVSRCLAVIKGIKWNPCVGEMIRGELILPTRDTPPGSVGRSLVNGWVHRSLDPTAELPAELSNVHFVAYQAFSAGAIDYIRSKQMKWLADVGFETPWWTTLSDLDLTDAQAEKLVMERKEKSPYPTDGIVFGRDTTPLAVEGGEASNPDDAVAFKMTLDEQKEETTVVAVEWNPSRQGFLIPRIQIEPVTIGGARIEWLTGHNAAIIEKEGVGVGAVIVVRRSGDVIPTLDSVVVRAAIVSAPPEGTWVWDATHVHAVMNATESGSAAGGALAEKAILHCLQTLEVDGIGPGLVKKLVEGGLTTMAAVAAAKPEALGALVGAGRGPALHAAFRERWSAAGPSVRLIASNLLPRGVGDRKLRPLFAIEADPRRWTTTFVGRSVEGWSLDTLSGLLAILPAAFAWEEKVAGAAGSEATTQVPATQVPATQVPATQAQPPVKGQVVFSGVRDKAFEAQLTAAGWAVEDSVTKKTTVLVIADAAAGTETGKVKKARAAGVEILSLGEAKANLLHR